MYKNTLQHFQGGASAPLSVTHACGRPWWQLRCTATWGCATSSQSFWT